MRRIAFIFVSVLIGALLVHTTYEFFTADEGIQYFSCHPGRLFYAIILGVSGCLVPFGISRLPRMLKLVALGGFGTLFIAGLGFYAYLLWFLFNGSAWWAWEAASFVGGVWPTSVIWLEFRKVWRQTRENGQSEH